jgi:hypothetical protein
VRDVADGLIIRTVTSLPWTAVPVPIAADALAAQAQDWRADGRFERLIAVVRETRGSIGCR